VTRPGILSTGLAFTVSYLIVTNEKIRELLFFFAKDTIIYNIPLDLEEICNITFIITLILLFANIAAKNINIHRIKDLMVLVSVFTLIISLTLIFFEYQNWLSFPNGNWISPDGLTFFESSDSFYISFMFSCYVVLWTFLTDPLDQFDPFTFSFKEKRERRSIRRRRSTGDLFRNIHTDPSSDLHTRRLNQEGSLENPPVEPANSLPEPSPQPEELEEPEVTAEPEQKEKSRAEIVLERIRGEES